MTTSTRTMDALRDEVRRHVSILDVAKARGLDLHKSGREWLGRCPFHDDKAPSLRVNPSKDGGVWRCDPCNVGGDAIRLVELLDRSSFPDALRRIAADHGIEIPKPREVAVYRYTDTGGAALGAKRRWEPAHDGSGKRKSFTWEGPDGRRGQPKPWEPTLYRLPEVIAAIAEGRTVLVVEGEKCVDALAATGFVATSNEDGAGKWKAEHAQHLRGAHVVVLPDNDEAGRSHGATVLRSLRGVAKSVRLIDLPDLPPKGDVADYLATHSAADLQALLDDKASMTTSRQREPGDDDDRDDEGEGEPVDAAWAAELKRARTDLQDAMGAGPSVLATPCEFTSYGDLIRKQIAPLDWLVQGLITEGAVVALSGEPKTSKTWLALELAVSIALGDKVLGEFRTGEPRGVALFLTEDCEASVRARLVGTIRGHAIEDATERDLPIYIKSRGALNIASIESLAWLVASVRRLPPGIALVVIDPLRNVMQGLDENSADDAEVISRHLRALRDVLGAAPLYIHHSGKSTEANQGRSGGQKMRGSSALHGAYDAGIHLSHAAETIEGNVTTRTATLESEVKAGRGAGKFSVTLTIHDGRDRQCVRADWEYSSETRAEQATEGQAARDEAAVLGVFGRPGAAARLSKSALAIASGGNKAKRLAAVDRCLSDGRLVGVVEGKSLMCSVDPDGSGSRFQPYKGLEPRTVNLPSSGDGFQVPGNRQEPGTDVSGVTATPTLPHTHNNQPANTEEVTPTNPATWQVHPPLVGARRAAVTHRIDLDSKAVGPELRGAFVTELARRLDADEDRVRLNRMCGRAMGLYQ